MVNYKPKHGDMEMWMIVVGLKNLIMKCRKGNKNYERKIKSVVESAIRKGY